MLNTSLQYFKQFKFLSLEDIGQLITIGRIKTFQKDEMVSRSGMLNYHAVVVLKGILRAYTVTSSGEEITLAFATRGMELASPRSIFKNEPSIDNIQALESTWVLEIDTRKFEDLASKNFSISRFHNSVLKKTVLMATERIEFYVTLNSEEKFEHLQKTHPELIQRVPQKYLASYIGITEVSLSRLKSRILTKTKTS